MAGRRDGRVRSLVLVLVWGEGLEISDSRNSEANSGAVLSRPWRRIMVCVCVGERGGMTVGVVEDMLERVMGGFGALVRG